MEMIDKDALVAEIEKRRINWSYGSSIEAKYKREECDDILSFLDTFEVKEVDLDKELNKYFITNNLIAADVQFEPFTHLYNCAKHFFGLGLSSQLSWKDIELIAEIGMDFMNSEDSDNLNDEEYYTEILNRFKAQKGE